MKLAAKLILIFLLGVFGIVALSAWQTIRYQDALDQRRREDHAEQLVDALAPAIAKAYREGGTVTLEQAVEISSRTVGGTKMRWLDGVEVPAPQTKTTTRQVSSVSITNADGTRTAFSYVPLKLNGQDAGTVQVAHPMTTHDAFVHQSIITSILSLLGVTLLSAAVIYAGGVRMVGRPLDRLIAQVNEIGDGNLDQPVALTGNDELGRLAKAISGMSRRLKQQRDTIRHTDRLGTVGTLAAGLAHELGTPLNVVSGRAGLIASGKLSTDEIQSSASTIKAEADRMTAIIRQLLDFARQQPSPHEPTDLRELVMRTCELMKPLAAKSNVSIAVDTPPDPLVVAGDAAQLQQVLTNLISNALAAMPEGGNLTVSLAVDAGSNQAVMLVADTGIGIASAELPKLFEPFYTTKEVGEGTGLGLSIAYGIVREHGGEITVKSEPGQGSTFRVSLPFTKQEPQA